MGIGAVFGRLQERQGFFEGLREASAGGGGSSVGEVSF